MDRKEELAVIRRYLLGERLDDEEDQRIEERILLEDGFAELVMHAEAELMEEYLDNSLNDSDRARFREFFLLPSERRNDLLLIENLRRISANAAVHPSRQPVTNKSPRPLWKLLFSLNPVTAGIFLVIALGIAFGIWRNVAYESDAAKGLTQLRIAYKDQRPFESRITALPDYAVFSETRGGTPTSADPAALDRAHRYLVDATSGLSDWRAHHVMGLHHLTSGDFDGAIRELDRAASSEPNSGFLQADIGAAYLEMAKRSASSGDGGKALELLNESLKHLNRAIELDPKLPESRFNKALCLELLMNLEQAKAAWREYLELDPNSAWANEAKQNLRKLEEETLRQRSAAELDSDFSKAYRDRDLESAGKLLRANRELIRERHMPQRLAMSLVEAAPDERDEIGRTLTFSGQLELGLTGDHFAADLASYYAGLSESKIAPLRQAQEQVRKGYKLSLDHEYEFAVESFLTAKEIFHRHGDVWESKIAQYLLGYALINSRENDRGLRELIQVSKFASDRDYFWLDATALYWIGGSYVKAKQYSLAKTAFSRALSTARKIDDPYCIQRSAIELSNLYSYSGQGEPALRYLHIALSASSQTEGSPRQRYRNSIDAFVTFSRMKLFDAAIAPAVEAVWLADEIGDDVWKAQSRNFAAVAYAQIGDFGNARKHLNEGITLSQSIAAEANRKSEIAFSQLKFGDVERLTGNHEKAEQHYLQAIDFYDAADMPLNREEAHKGILMNYLALGKVDGLESRIKENLRLTEEYRARIAEEGDRIGFFDVRSSIYDIATAFEFERGNSDAAYEYAEMSSARTLLDRLTKGERVEAGESLVPAGLASEMPEVTLAGIRQQLPEDAQILQYSVLENNLLIWVVSRTTFGAATVPVSASSLEDKVSGFRRLILSRADLQDPQLFGLGRELYDLLIRPVRDQIDPKKEICIIPSKSLFKLPFAALISPDGAPVVSEFVLLHAPSASVYLKATNTARKKYLLRNESALVVGNPAFDREKFDRLPDLRDAAAEARTISGFYDKANLLVGESATKRSFLAALSTAEVIHVAAHYVVVPGAPSSSYLLMAPGREDGDAGEITNFDLSETRLPKAKLMVLAACQSGLERVYNGEGMIGITRTMLAADLPLVVGSQWPVDSGGTASLMPLFHNLRTRGQSTTTAALRAAQLQLFTDPSGTFRAPYHWAAFGVYGGHANF